MRDATTRTPQGLRGLRSWLKRRAGPPRRELIAARGWPGEALVGRQAAGAAWLLAQHADRRPDFQREYLELLAAAVTAGDADPQHGALLEDRVLVAQGQRQVFGTQLTQGPDGTLVSHPVRDPDSVEALRAAWGFEPLETYIEQVVASAWQGGLRDGTQRARDRIPPRSPCSWCR